MRALVSLALLAAVAVLGPTRAEAQPVLAVVDAGSGEWSAPLDADALRAGLAEASGRAVVGLADPRGRACRQTLTLARVSADRWVLRFDAPDAEPTFAEHPVRAEAPLDGLVGAAVALLLAHGAFDARETVPGADLVNPFGQPRWDPLRVALAGQLHAVAAPREPLSYVDVVDPFRPIDRGATLVDPWAR